MVTEWKGNCKIYVVYYIYNNSVEQWCNSTISIEVSIIEIILIY